MTARTGLSQLIDVLRGYCDAGPADYQIGTANFWDGDHLQAVLDRHRMEVVSEPLNATPRVTSGGSVSWYDYASRFENYEQTTGGTAVFWLEDSTGADIGTASYSVDYLSGRVTFAADTSGTVYYLTGRAYDLNAAAAEVWRTKAGQAAKVYDISTDKTKLTRSQIMQHCVDMANVYEGRAAPHVTTLVEG